MPSSTSALLIKVTMTTPRQVPITETWPPASTAPPITGAAKERISQSSPMVGWPSCRRATASMPAMAASSAESTWAATTTRPTRMPESSAAWRLAPTASICRPSTIRSNSSQTPTMAISGTISIGGSPPMRAAPNAFTASGMS